MIFRATFEAFKLKLRKNQKQKSNWVLTKWSVHDYAKFKDLIERLRSLIDSLEDITNALGVLGQQHARLAQEIESISDTHSLRLLQDTSSSNASSRASRLVADTASHRLQLFGESSRSDGWSSIYKETTSSQSYYTAYSIIEVNANDENRSNQHKLGFASAKGDRRRDLVIRSRDNGAVHQSETQNGPKKTTSETIDIPQNQRMIAELVKTAKITSQRPELSFKSEARDYGNVLSDVRAADEKLWLEYYPPLLNKANNSMSVAQRVFLEIRSIRRAAVPFISASPVKDQSDKVLASIEGPLDTPYAGGIFWISVQFLDAKRPPSLRFQTRILHPNIDCTGQICADYKAWWDDPMLSRHVRGIPATNGTPWFSTSNSKWFSLGAVLTALCGLIASPNIEDPLVPEVAEMYLKDYDGYCKAAKMYTERYADGVRPDEDQIVYAHEENADGPSQTYHRAAQGRAPASSSVRGLASIVGSDDKQEVRAEDQDDTESSQPSDFEGRKHEEEKTDTEWSTIMSVKDSNERRQARREARQYYGDIRLSEPFQFERYKHGVERQETDKKWLVTMSVKGSDMRQRWKHIFGTDP